MRIAFLTTSPDWTGSARAFAMAARAFATAGDDVRFLVPPDSRVQEHLAREPYVVEPVDLGGWWLSRALRLSRVLSHHRSDVVFLHTASEHIAVALSAPIRGKRGVVRRVPAGGRAELGWSTKLACRLARSAFLFASEKEAREALVPAELGPSFAATPGIESADEAPTTQSEDAVEAAATDSYHIICIYDGISRGRTALPVRTVALMAPRHPEIRLSIVGPGSDAEEIRMHVAALDVLTRVDLLGERDDLQQLMRGATLGWIACRGDDAAFAILDLMAEGLPVVAPDDGICERYVADGITGMVVRGEDAALAAGILAGVLGNARQIAAMSHAARVRLAREFPETRMLAGFDAAATAVRSGGIRVQTEYTRAQPGAADTA
ncbi:MAG TPA: glycosyltransferase [Gemmatimonadaceae bacterium]|nr:glycosyltransferase [Gemmatimonadaceae bacterium]